MKSLKSILLGIPIFFLTSSLFATENENDLVIQQIRYLKSTIGEQIAYPDAAHEKAIEGIVATNLYVDDFGKVSVVAINGHPSLTFSVKHQIESMNLEKNSLLAGEEIILKINFKIE